MRFLSEPICVASGANSNIKGDLVNLQETQCMVEREQLENGKNVIYMDLRSLLQVSTSLLNLEHRRFHSESVIELEIQSRLPPSLFRLSVDNQPSPLDINVIVNRLKAFISD